jgi:hypothetical protein
VLIPKISNIGIGQKVKIEFLGKVKSQTKGRSPYKEFAVFIDHHLPPQSQRYPARG